MIRTQLFWASSSAAAILSVAYPALAADYYFDSVDGSDDQLGTTEATAKKTLKTPSGSGHTMHIRRGSSWTMGLSLSNVTVTTYGSGERPTIHGSISVNNATVEGLKAMPTTSNAFNVQNNSVVRDCEADGANCTKSVVGMGIMGTGNKIIGNYVHDFRFSQSGGEMDNSGGAEGFMVMASDNEVAYNTAVNLYSDNATLGGYEGGCFEIVNGKALSTISNVSFHHNYCERSVGLWEGCSGDFSATGGNIQENHGIIENVTVSYNIAVDSQWMYLLQPVNTDFRNVVFANNTIIHTPKSKEYWPNSNGYTSMAMVVATYTNEAAGQSYDTDNQYFKKGAGFQPGTIIVKNNIFVDDVSSTRNVMFMSNLTDHSNNLFVPSNASVSFGSDASAFALHSTEKKVNLADLAFTSDYRLTAASTPAIDQGTIVGMSDNGVLAVTTVKSEVFQDAFRQDIDKHAVPSGAAPDIGASEYAGNAGGMSSGGGTSSGGTAGGPLTTAPNGGSGVVGLGGAAGAVAPPANTGTSTIPDANEQGGDEGSCSCTAVGISRSGTWAAFVSLGLAVMLLARRRHSEG